MERGAYDLPLGLSPEKCDCYQDLLSRIKILEGCFKRVSARTMFQMKSSGDCLNHFRFNTLSFKRISRGTYRSAWRCPSARLLNCYSAAGTKNFDESATRERRWAPRGARPSDRPTIHLTVLLAVRLPAHPTLRPTVRPSDRA